MKIKDLDKSKLYYVASPFTHKSKKVEKEREREISHIGAKLMLKHGLKVILPITTSFRLKQLVPELGTTWDSWKEVDETYLNNCQGLIVVMMDGWVESVGVQAEIDIATRRNIDIYYLNPKSFRVFDGFSEFALEQAIRQVESYKCHI